MNAVGSALYAKLTAGTALIAALGGTAIYNTLAPQGATPPYVIFFESAGSDDNDSPRRARSMTYTVKAITKDDMEEAGEIDTLLDPLLHGQELTVSGWDNYWCYRVSDVSYAQPGGGGVVYFHEGGQYRVRIAE